MMDRLRSPVQTFAAIASLVSALSLTGLGTSHAGAPKSPPSSYVNEQSCNDICRAYLNWSHRVMALFQPSLPGRKTAAPSGRPPRVVDHAAGPRRPALNSFAQWPSQRAATPAAPDTLRAAAMPPAEAAASRPRDEIADPFPATRELLTAMRAYSRGGPRDAAGSTVGMASGMPAGQGSSQASSQANGTVEAVVGALDIGRAALSLFAFLTLPALVLLWRRSRRDAERQRLSDRAEAMMARRKPGQMHLAPEFGPLT